MIVLRDGLLACAEQREPHGPGDARLPTRRSVFPNLLTVAQAMGVLETWLAQPAAILLQPTPRRPSLLHGLLAPLGTAANHVYDAHLAALAIGSAPRRCRSTLISAAWPG